MDMLGKDQLVRKSSLNVRICYDIQLGPLQVKINL